jgi:hypothetical protein
MKTLFWFIILLVLIWLVLGVDAQANYPYNWR